MNKFNNFVTTLGTIVASIAAIFSTINNAAIQRVDGKVKNLDLQVKALDVREKKEQVSQTFADVFLNTVLPDSQIKERNCFDALENLFHELCGSPKDGGNAVINAAIIVGTWARNITPDTASRVPGTSMPQLALQTAKLWRKNLTDSKIPDWGSTITALNELIRRAEVVQQKNAALTLVAPK